MRQSLDIENGRERREMDGALKDVIFDQYLFIHSGLGCIIRPVINYIKMVSAFLVKELLQSLPADLGYT
jgi:hypothetical protein